MGERIETKVDVAIDLRQIEAEGSGWKIINASEAGTSHLKTSQPCQDFSCAQVLKLGLNQHVLILTCADGAGSASHSELGSKAACTHLQQLVRDGLLYLGDVASLEYEDISSWFVAVKNGLHKLAAEEKLDPQSLACTLLLSIVGTDYSIFAQIGDGAIVVKHAEQFQTVFWPQSGEYFNITNFVTSDDLESKTQITHLQGRIDNIAMFTDGLELLALNFKEHDVHVPFFEPMFARLQLESDPSSLEEPLRQFLQSSPVNAKTDDDKTLIMATRTNATVEEEQLPLH